MDFARLGRLLALVEKAEVLPEPAHHALGDFFAFIEDAWDSFDAAYQAVFIEAEDVLAAEDILDEWLEDVSEAGTDSPPFPSIPTRELSNKVLVDYILAYHPSSEKRAVVGDLLTTEHNLWRGVLERYFEEARAHYAW